MEEKEKTLDEETIKELVEKGLVYGHKKSRTNPRMRPYIAGMRNEIELINPKAILGSLEKAIQYLRELKRAKGEDFLLLVVGLTAPAWPSVHAFAEEFNFPYAKERWLGGTLTNLKVIRGRIDYYEKLKRDYEAGELQKYTKKEQHDFKKMIDKLEKVMSGLTRLTRLPDALFIVDPAKHMTAVREAHRLGIPIVAIMDTDDDPELVKHPIIAADHNRSGIKWIMERISEGLRTIANNGTVENTSLREIN